MHPEALDRVKRVGCKVTLHTVFGDVQKTAWLRNFEYAEVEPLGLAENIAMILACTDALEVADRRTESGRR